MGKNRVRPVDRYKYKREKEYREELTGGDDAIG
jgi:hypothetical protein